MNISGAIREIYKLYIMSLKKKYLGSKMGVLWAVIQPMMTMLMYIFVFSVVFKSRTAASDNPIDYIIWFLCGLTPWMAINEGIMSTLTSVISGSDIIKNFRINAECLTISSALSGIPQMLVGICTVLILSILYRGNLSWHLILLFPIIIVMLIFISGLGFFLAATAVFKRDIIQIIPTIVQFVFYFTPIFYDISQFPGLYEVVTFFNPIYQIVSCFRNILYYQQIPDWKGVVYLFFISILIVIGGRIYFKKLKGFFESAL